MKKNTVVFFTVPLHGHMNPVLSLIHRLTQQDILVICYSTAEFQSQITTAGATFRAYPGLEHVSVTEIRHDLVRLTDILIRTNEKLIAPVTKELKNEHIDYIFHDSFASIGKVVGKKLGIPTYSIFTTLTFSHSLLLRYPAVALTFFLGVMRGLPQMLAVFVRFYLASPLRKEKLSFTDVFMGKGSQNIAFTSRSFHPGGDKMDSSYHFMGPSITQRDINNDLVNWINPKKKLIYISLGTVFNANTQFYKTCITAFHHTHFQVLISVGQQIHVDDLGEIPDHIRLEKHVPQTSILPHAAVFISHGGFNSVSESMYFGVPMILIPQMAEQLLNSKRVEELGAGVVLKKNRINPSLLRKTVFKILADEKYKKAAQEIGEGLINASENETVEL